MRAFPYRVSSIVKHFLMLAIVTLFSSVAILAQAQATAADLVGTVTDPTGAVVAGATVTAKNSATNISRSAVSGADGSYQLIGLPPGSYQVTTEAKGFKKTVIPQVTLTIGQSAELTIKLEVGSADVVVNVDADSVELVETTRTTVANTIDQKTINNLPVNERSATGFALTISTVGRDNGRPIGPAPTSGLNIGGQRGRSTLVQVDGADFTDNSINAARSTVSQEAVQEYQVTTNSYMPEFGRATGGIVNVVTKGGGNEFRGNMFGFIRHKTIQARNAFAPLIDNDPNKKPPYTRVQYGLTFGGPLVKDRTFFFFSFEQRRRQESGFFTGDIIQGATSSVTVPAGFLLPTAPVTFTGLTSAQAAYVNAALGSGDAAQIQRGIAYAQLASTGFQTAQNGTSSNVNFLPGLGVTQGTAVGSRFILSGAPVPLTKNAAGQFIAFRPLTQLAKVFPISEASTYNSVRLDHLITDGQQFSMRFGYNPSRITGIQDESQNQTLGQNDYSRTGIQKLKDSSFGASLVSVLPRNFINELYFNFGRRKATFDSQVPSIAHQIAGTGFIGSNPFSPVDRRENRFQIRDNINWVKGDHTFKFGADFNFIDIEAQFQVNFPGLFNFSQQSGGSLVSVAGVGCDSATLALKCPALTAVQAYGLGFPSVFIQGFGNPNSVISNKPVAFFAQDTWKAFKNFTINYGVRYDYEFTQEFAPTAFKDPLTGITLTAADVQAAQDKLNVTQGFPRDGNNWAPRLGFAWDLKGDSKTVVRGAIGMFYDHPLLVVSFNSDIADGSQQQQSTLLPIGGPSPLGLFNAFQVFHGTVIPCNFTGATPGVNCTPGLASSAQYLQGQQRFNSSTFTGFGPILPFTLNVAKNFEFPYAIQGNFAVERQINKDTAVSASFITVNSRHLAHPQDVNNVNLTALVDNFKRYFGGAAPASLTQAAFGISLPTTAAAGLFSCPTLGATALCFQNPVTTQYFLATIPGMVALRLTGNPAAGGLPVAGSGVVNPIMADYFRKAGPNYFFIASASGGQVTKALYDAAITGTGALATPGLINPYADVNAQLSDANSSYNALNVELKKRISTNIQMLASYTWSHSIDYSSDLQTLLKPQDNLNFKAEKSNSLFDQRHRFVYSAVFNSPDSWKSADGFKKFLNGFSVAPIVEISSGRPFNILAVGDANADFQSTNERPNLRSDGSLCAATVDANCGTFPTSGTLGRNMGITHGYFSVDLRLTRTIRFNERINLSLIAEGFNLLNRFNEAAANSDYRAVNSFGKRASNGAFYSFSTAAFDPRQFQFGAKLNF
ncbi:MAG: TonB-dependent receptor [Pyrinomonadaceae bacterium]|nr:TonB-dependent receptor [Pyrinomonadaceae bacterium]